MVTFFIILQLPSNHNQEKKLNKIVKRSTSSFIAHGAASSKTGRKMKTGTDVARMEYAHH